MGHLHYYYDTDSVVRRQKTHEKRARAVLKIERVLGNTRTRNWMSRLPNLNPAAARAFSKAMTTMIKALLGPAKARSGPRTSGTTDAFRASPLRKVL